jgi:hypothetical protein
VYVPGLNEVELILKTAPVTLNEPFGSDVFGSDEGVIKV